MRTSLGVLIIVPALLVAAACTSAPAAPTAAPPPPKAAATTPPKAEEKPAAKPTEAPAAKPTDKPAAKAEAKPTEAAAAKPAVAAAVTKDGTFKLAEKPGVAPYVAPAMNAAGGFNPANTMILYGDLALFAGKDNPENCILKSRYKKGEPVGFRMSAIDPATGKFSETAQVVVKIPYAGKTETIEMRYRGTGDNPRPGFWTAKWVVPDDAPTGVIKYWVEAKDKDGKTATWQPFNIEASMLTIVP